LSFGPSAFTRLQRVQCRSRLTNISTLLAVAAAGLFITTTSSPDNRSCCWRKDSRMTLFIRLRAVARRQCFFEIARPSLAVAVSFCRHSTVNRLSRLRFALSNTRPKAAASSSRLSLRNRLLELLFNPGVARVVATAGDALRRQLGAALGAAALEDETPGLRRHAGTKTVVACTLDLAGLICAFHGLSRNPIRGKNSVQNGARAGPRSKKGGKGTEMPLCCQ
jgi:hypothetical protein